MLTKQMPFAGANGNSGCYACSQTAVIEMHGYSEGKSNIQLCADCALQLNRKLSEDLCELLARGGRHG